MSLIVRAVALLVALIVSAHARLHAVLLGQPINIPWLGVAAVLMVLVLVALVLWLAHLIVQERPQKPAYRPVYVVTDLT